MHYFKPHTSRRPKAVIGLRVFSCRGQIKHNSPYGTAEISMALAIGTNPKGEVIRVEFVLSVREANELAERITKAAAKAITIS